MSGAYALSASDVSTALLFPQPDWPAPIAPAVAAAVPEQARKLNTRGEAAYHSGDYALAIRFFQAAIAWDEGYGQAYSNLGLVFQKDGQVPEALWANRKAIVLAAGPSAATTRAGTHFNNGRIYEDKNQWDDALREYAAAQHEKSNAIYVTAMARAEQHGAHQP